MHCYLPNVVHHLHADVIQNVVAHVDILTTRVVAEAQALVAIAQDVLADTAVGHDLLF